MINIQRVEKVKKASFPRSSIADNRGPQKRWKKEGGRPIRYSGPRVLV